MSVVIASRGAWRWLDEALHALHRNTTEAYEVVIVDNDSPDETPVRLRELKGVKLRFNDENRGFGAAANHGAELASAPVLCFLNSDALVEEGWLPPLLETLLDDLTVGAVVPMILNLDGTVQEAGSAIDADGWATAMGADADPANFEYRFRRVVDFGSAACMLVRKEDFDRLGGFDPIYGLGYYEDVDLCYRLRERGLTTVYQPRSRVRHVRWASSGDAEARALMQRNRALFLDRWRGRLERRPAVHAVTDAPHRLVAVRDVEASNRILVIDDRVPHHDRGSGDPRMAGLLGELVDMWPDARVTLLALSPRNAEEYGRPLLERGVEVVAGPPDLEKWFRSRLFHYSVVVVSRPYNAHAVETLLARTQPQALVVYDAEALFFRRLEREARSIPWGDRPRTLLSEAAAMRRMETKATRRADAVLCVSVEEQEVLSAFAPETPSFVVPAFVEPSGRAPGFSERRDLVFFGGFMAGSGSPNEDAATYLVREVMPHVWTELGDVTLHIAGANPTPAVEALHGDRVNVVGFVDEPQELLHRMRVHASPLRFGAGIKLKLLDSMAAGLPFVTTPVGAEGLHLDDLTPRLVGNDATSLAALIWTLYTDEDAWERARRGLDAICREHFSRRQFAEALVEALSHVGLAPPDRTPAKVDPGGSLLAAASAPVG